MKLQTRGEMRTWLMSFPASLWCSRWPWHSFKRTDLGFKIF